MYAAIAVFDFDLSDDEIELRVERRRLRDRANVLELKDTEFVSNFRVNKEVFQHIFTEVSVHMRTTYRNTHLPPQLKLSTFLRFLATGSYQKSVGNECVSSMSQSTVAKVIKECLTIFEEHFCQKWVVFQKTNEEENIVKEQYYDKYGIPGVIGCVDGTHVRIKSPGMNSRHLFYNRKGFYSLNVMVICDLNMVISFVDARHPGANHDSFIWKYSAAEQQLRFNFINGKRNTWLLGDSGYPLEPYLMTPYRNPTDESERRFNEKHCKARNVVERCFGVLKNRFRSIIGSRGLHYSPEKAIQIVNACSAIHNSCIFYKHDWPPLNRSDALEGNENTSNDEVLSSEASNIAIEVRRSIAESLQ